MRLLKPRDGDSGDETSLYHGSPFRRTVLKAGGQAARISVAVELEGNGTRRACGRDASGPGARRPGRTAEQRCLWSSREEGKERDG